MSGFLRSRIPYRIYSNLNSKLQLASVTSSSSSLLNERILSPMNKGSVAAHHLKIGPGVQTSVRNFYDITPFIERGIKMLKVSEKEGDKADVTEIHSEKEPQLSNEENKQAAISAMNSIAFAHGVRRGLIKPKHYAIKFMVALERKPEWNLAEEKTAIFVRDRIIEKLENGCRVKILKSNWFKNWLEHDKPPNL